MGSNNQHAKYYTPPGSYRGAIRIKGRWVSAKDLNRIDKAGWVRWMGPPSPAILRALQEPPVLAHVLCPDRVISSRAVQMLDTKSTRIVKLSNSDRFAIIDAEDFPKICKYTWRLMRDKRTNTSYVVTSVREGKKVRTLRLHRLVMDATPGKDVHHIDFDPLNNRKANLVEVDPSAHRGHSRDYSYPTA